jgi:hypothetical protein
VTTITMHPRASCPKSKRKWIESSWYSREYQELSVPYSALCCGQNLVLVACRQNFDLENKDNSIKHKY